MSGNSDAIAFHIGEEDADYVRITITNDNNDGLATDVAGTGNKLSFRLNIDQTHLSAIVTSLTAMLKKHPVRKF